MAERCEQCYDFEPGCEWLVLSPDANGASSGHPQWATNRERIERCAAALVRVGMTVRATAGALRRRSGCLVLVALLELSVCSSSGLVALVVLLWLLWLSCLPVCLQQKQPQDGKNKNKNAGEKARAITMKCDRPAPHAPRKAMSCRVLSCLAL